MTAFTDNEGCLTDGKGRAFGLAALSRLRAYLQQRPDLRLILCTGRSAPYCEALLQAAGLQNSPWPMICEGGAALYTPQTDRIEVIAPALDFRGLLARIPSGLYYLEPGKLACLTLYPEPGRISVPALAALVQEACAACGLEACVVASAAAVDITHPQADKGSAARLVAQRHGWDLAQCLGFGDAANDLPLLAATGWKAAPANAAPEVAAACQYQAPQPYTAGLLQALRWWQRGLTGD